MNIINTSGPTPGILIMKVCLGGGARLLPVTPSQSNGLLKRNTALLFPVLLPTLSKICVARLEPENT